MPRNAEALKIEPWADSGNRNDPEDESPPVNRAEGWTLEYSQPGGPLVSRELWNQILREITGMLHEINQGGIPDWDETVDYIHPAFVRHGGTLYISLMQEGLAGAEPGGSEVWREY